MTDMRAWAAAVCLAALACAALRLLTPKNGLGRLFQLTMAAFFLCCMLSPLLSLYRLSLPDLAMLPDSTASELLQERVRAQLEQQTQTALQETCDAALAAYGLSAKKVTATMDTDENGGIYITDITVLLDKQQAVNRVAIRQVLNRRLETDVTIQVEGEDGA